MNPKFEYKGCEQNNTDKGEERMKYVVKINYYSFRFEDATEAMEFAKTAMEKADADDNVEVRIVLEKDEGEE